MSHSETSFLAVAEPDVNTVPACSRSCGTPFPAIQAEDDCPDLLGWSLLLLPLPFPPLSLSSHLLMLSALLPRTPTDTQQQTAGSGVKLLGKTPHTASDGKLAWLHVRRIAQQQDQNRSAGHLSGVGAGAAALRVASGCRCQLLSRGLSARMAA